MNKETRRVAELATRVNGYASLVEEDFPANGIGGQRFSMMKELAVKIDQHSSRQALEKGSARAMTEAKKPLRYDIRRRLMVIRKTALSVEPVQAGISQKFNMPASNSDESLIEAARASSAAATPLKSLFLSREMPDNFLEELANAIEMFEEFVNNYNMHFGNSAAATELLNNVCAQVIAVWRELDPIVRNKYRNDPEKLSLWETASHLERPSKRAASKKPGGSQTPPPDGQS
jgi:hypothetical protein